jgi:hypothetical protein
MAITTLDDYIGAAKQRVTIIKTATRPTILVIPFSMMDIAGSPGASPLAVGNTANGIVPTDLAANYPILNDFGVGNTGYLSGVDFANTVACRLAVFDTIFSAGAYPFNANVTLASQPSYSSRVIAGDYKGLELWMEAASSFVNSQTITVTYTNQDGVTGQTTGAIATGVNPTIGRMLQLPLQTGDTGIQAIESVLSSGSTAGTFNIHVLRRLWMARVASNNSGDNHDFLKTGLPVVFADSALRFIVWPDSTLSGIPEFSLEIANG